MPWEDTEDYIRSGHASGAGFDPKSYRTVSIGKGGIKAIVGCPRGKFVGGRCKVGMRVKSYLFPKSKGWTKEKAKAWVARHKSKKKDNEETQDSIRTKIASLKSQRDALYKQSDNIYKKQWKEIDAETEKIRNIVRKKYEPQLQEIHKKTTAISSEITALEYALGERL